MLQQTDNSREAIKSRILRYALNFWDIRNADELDPFVKLIMEALSVELYSLGNDIKNSEVRILEKISNLLAPDLLTCPNTAHAILHATPAETTEVITPADHFFIQQKVASKADGPLDTNLDVFFTPVDNVILFSAHVRYLVTGRNWYAYDESFNKVLLTETIKGKLIENHALWIGLDVSEDLDTITNLSFYFEWKDLDVGVASKVYQLLPLTKWYIGETELKVSYNLKYNINLPGTGAGQNLFSDYDVLPILEADIKHYYSNKFITITDEELKGIKEIKEVYPLSFNDIFGESDIQNLNGQLLWIKVLFPAALQQDVLNGINVYTNAFPIMNRYLNNKKSWLKSGRTIIPLSTSKVEQFLAVRSVTDKSRSYRAIPYNNKEVETGTYSLRAGGVERFDNRNASEIISFLLQLLRSESAAFSAYGHDFIATLLKEMNQRLALMEQKTKGLMGNSLEVPNYIVVKPSEDIELIYVEYWTTLAEAANNIRCGTYLQQYSGLTVKPESILLLSSTTGGRNKLKPDERLNAFKYGLMTRNRIITKEDIRSFCFYHLEGRISNVTISKGFDVSDHPREGFRRIINIFLTPSNAEALKKEEWEILCEQLKIKLQSRSGMSNNYKIQIHSPAG